MLRPYASAEGWHQAVGYTMFCLFWATVGAVVGLVFMPIMFLVSTWPFGFICGYFYCQWLLDEGQLPLSSIRNFRVMKYLGVGLPMSSEINRLENFRLRNGWKITFVSSILLLVFGTIFIITKVSEGIVISLPGTPWLALLSGYSYRQHIIDRGRCPKWRFLRLIGDCADS